jgi:hypothetical protein
LIPRDRHVLHAHHDSSDRGLAGKGWGLVPEVSVKLNVR